MAAKKAPAKVRGVYEREEVASGSPCRFFGATTAGISVGRLIRNPE